VQVLLTIGVLAVIALWGIAVVRRLEKMRGEITHAWKRLEVDQSNEAVKTVYNRHVVKYNEALGSFPAYLFGPLFGFKPARHF
jgi:hypothetical protein